MTAAATLEMPMTDTHRRHATSAIEVTPSEGDITPSNVPAGPAGIDRIVLTGFMGSGKTTAGRLLAQRLGWRLLDLDNEIERREGRSVPQIFAESGEAHFRRAEAAALASVLGQRKVVLALGGGAPEELGNRLLLEQTPHTAVVYLSAPFEVLVERCHSQIDATDRPVLADLEHARARFTQRRPHYERIARHRVETTSMDAEATVAAVLAVLAIR
jgi:shikimate kinase